VVMPQPFAAEATTSLRVETADAQLAAGERDAWIFAELDERDVYRAVVVTEASAPTRLSLPDIEEELERIALGTRAGRLIAGFVAASQQTTTPITKLERASQWPVAVLRRGDTLYVNPSWLIALAEGDAPSASSGGAGGGACTRTCGTSTGTKTEIPPELEGIASSQQGIIIEALAGYYGAISIRNSIDECSDRCNQDCNDRCDRACDNACDDTFKCEMGATKQKRRVTDGEVIAMAICLLLFPAVQRWRSRRARLAAAQQEIA
jgi:hypothetical protein